MLLKIVSVSVRPCFVYVKWNGLSEALMLLLNAVESAQTQILVELFQHSAESMPQKIQTVLVTEKMSSGQAVGNIM